MANGTIKIQTTVGQGVAPIANANYAIFDKGGRVLYSGQTDANGEAGPFTLPAPDRSLSQEPNPNIEPYSKYDIWIGKPGFADIRYIDAEVFDGVQGIIPANMQPAELYDEEQINVIPPPTAQQPSYDNSAQIAPPDEPITTPMPFSGGAVPQVSGAPAGGVKIPEYITVHLGTPGNTGAPNVRVKFIDYIKNVASREIYPTWPENALIANIHVIVTFALNRIYTEWYRSRGFNYDITNSTSVDQAFDPNKEIFANISQIVDGIFNVYGRRTGFRNPYFTSYCNGTSSTCKGLSQWGTVTLAKRGLTPLQILHNYYPNDLELNTAPWGGVGPIESYPGVALTIGSQSEAVRRMQNQLNRIRGNFPNIPAITNPNGYFGADTAEAVRIFQRTFNLGQDGIVGRSTWNAIQQKFGAVTGLSELGGEGERIGLSPTPPTVTIRQGSTNRAANIQLQFLLNYISQFYPEVPSVIADSVFGAFTTTAVQAFQRRFGLDADGVVGAATWRKLYEIAAGIIGTLPPETPTPPIEPPTQPPVTPPAINPPFPGTLLRQGSRGEDVRTLQTMLNKARVHYNAIPLLAVDGIFGGMTNQAVRTFQLYHGLAVDGIVGPLTWNALVSLS